MGEFFFEYGLFLLKAITIVASIVVVAVFVIASAQREKEGMGKGHISITKINALYDETELAVRETTDSKQTLKKLEKSLKQKEKEAKKSTDDPARKRLFVLNFDGDIRASAVHNLREEITAILMVANEQDEVFVKLQSGGGMVHAYGLASSQLQRIKNKKIHLTASVDKIAASGGYMMACVADKIIAAPFAIVGSIGVIAQIPNFNRVLKKHDIDYEMITAGEYKRTLTMFGENTDKARAKFVEEIEDTHHLFKDFVLENRPQVDIATIATGEHWFATRAKSLALVDELMTSDDYLLSHRDNADIYEISYVEKKKLGAKLSGFMQSMLDRVVSLGWSKGEHRLQ